MFLRPALVSILPRRSVEVILANGGVINASALFSAGDWSSNIEKIITIPAGVTRGSSNPAQAVLTGVGSRGGKLRIKVAGSLLGAGGAAQSGKGGDVIDASAQNGVIIEGNGVIKAGGGGGANGGDGGGGIYYTGRLVTEGPFWDNNVSFNYGYNTNNGQWAWAGVVRGGFSNGINPGDGWNYYDGGADGGGGVHNIYRQQTVVDVPNNTSGGAHGIGGRGEGFDGARASGTAGSAGGTNAGPGGAGGQGGLYGASGGNGTDGTTGNRTGGSAAPSPGLAGYAILGLANVTNNFTGTFAGRTA